MTNITIDTNVVFEMATKSKPNILSKAESKPLSLPSSEDRKKAWSALFELDKIKKLKPKAEFGLSLQTDGVSASLLFKTENLEPAKPPKPVKRPKTVQKPKQHQHPKATKRNITQEKKPITIPLRMQMKQSSSLVLVFTKKTPF
jgi:hypothetical protein